MKYLNSADYTVIVVYFAILVGLGLYLKRMASASLEHYFLGGKKIPWWAMGITGMAVFLDMTGTMIIVSFLYLLGPRGLYIEFRGGAVLVLVFALLWIGKWHRRSNCMTGAEWMIYRFGEGAGGQFARLASAVSQMIWTVGMLAYLIKGAGLFLAMFWPFSPLTCSLIMIGITTLYTMTSGFYGVVYTDMFQSIIIFVAVAVVSTMAAVQVAGHENLAALAYEVTGSTDWMTTTPQWHTSMPPGYEQYKYLAMFAFFYLVKNVMQGMGWGFDPKYFGARNERECGTLTFLWTSLMMFRWPMMMGFAVLGIFLVKDLFPDHAVLAQSAELIKQTLTNIPKSRWEDTLAAIIHSPDRYPPELIAGLTKTLGSDWATRLNLVSFEGTVNPERILPAVILFMIPMGGLRGLIVVALLAAAMSTFDGTVNMTAGYFTRDIYQRYLRPAAQNRELIFATYFIILVLTAGGYALGYTTESINDIWGWIIMSLTAGMAVPLMVRLYWWRFNGGGFAIGTVVGLIASIVQRILRPNMVEWEQFLLLVGIALAGAILGTYLTKPTDPAILAHFYKTTRPFGFWGPLKNLLPPDERAATAREHFYDIIAVPFVLVWQVTLFLLPMQLVIRAFPDFWITLVIFLIGLAGVYFFWYRHLPPATKPLPITGTPQGPPAGASR